MLKSRFLIIVLTLAAMMPSVSAEASPPQDYQSNFPAVALGIAAGVATWQISYPTSMLDDGASTYHVVVDISTNVAPLAGVALALGTAGFAFSSPGCTVGVFVQDAVALNSVSGYVPITVAAGTKYCYGTGRFTLTLLPPINVIISAYRVNWEFEVESIHNTNYDYLCDALGITIAAHNDATSVCNDANLAFTGTLNSALSGTVNVVNSGTITNPSCLTTNTCAITVSDDANGWVVHQDPITGSLTICPESAPCFLEGNLLNGNITTNTNNTSDIGFVIAKWFPIWMGLAVLWIAVGRRDTLGVNYTNVGIAGMLFVFGAIVCPFNEIATTASTAVALVARILVLGLGLYCVMEYTLIKRRNNETDETETGNV